MAKRTRLPISWVLGGVLFGVFAFDLNWKFGVAWALLAVMGFVVIEKLLMRSVDQAAPR